MHRVLHENINLYCNIIIINYNIPIVFYIYVQYNSNSIYLG